jgi:hypothetical protein
VNGYERVSVFCLFIYVGIDPQCAGCITASEFGVVIVSMEDPVGLNEKLAQLKWKTRSVNTENPLRKMENRLSRNEKSTQYK